MGTLCILWGCVATAVPCASGAAVVISSLTVSSLDWGTVWAGQCMAAAGVFPAAWNCSAYPAKLTVVQRWCLWLTVSWVLLAAPSPGECSRGCVHPLVQLCKAQGCEGKGGRRKGWMDGWMGKGTAQVPGSCQALSRQYLLFCCSSHSSLLPVLPHPTLPDC